MKFNSLFVLFSIIHSSNIEQPTVYICLGPNSVRYHLTNNCRGLQNCSTELKTVTIEEARKLGRSLCGFED
jgi:hypothetical protein